MAIALSTFHSLRSEHISIAPDHLIKRTFFNRKEKILQICQDKLNQDIYTPEEKPIVEELKKWVTAQEIEDVETLIKKYEQEPFVFSHNDLLVNNVLVLKGQEKVVFIDYEYASFNFPFYDIANYFD